MNETNVECFVCCTLSLLNLMNCQNILLECCCCSSKLVEFLDSASNFYKTQQKTPKTWSNTVLTLEVIGKSFKFEFMPVMINLFC